MRAWSLRVLAVVMSVAPSMAHGQDVTVGAGGFAPAFPDVLVPPDGAFPPGSVTQASIKFSPMLGSVSASVRVPLRRSLWLEGEWTRAAGGARRSFDHQNGLSTRIFTTAAESRSTNVIAANLLWPVGAERVSTFFGAGIGIRRTDAVLDYDTRCESTVPNGCAGRITDARRFGEPMSGVTWQGIMGVEAAMTTRASVMWSVRLLRLGEASYEDDQNYGFAIDARLVLRRTPRQRSTAPPRRMRDAMLAGLVAGGFVGAAAGSTFSEEGRLVLPMYSIGIGAGAGALVGALWR
jgi:hypothetical protein